MPSFYSTIVSGIAALFSVSTVPPPQETTATLEEVRRDMLELLAGCRPESAASLQRRIRFAPDIQALWFMRSELMGLLARTCGEAEAREKIYALGIRFDGLLPPGLKSRVSFLDSGGHSSWSEPPGK